MAIATERWSERKLTRSIDGKWAAKLGWDVIGFTDENDAINATGYTVGSFHPRTGGLVCTKIGLEENKFSLGVVRAVFEVYTGTGSNPNPLLQPPQIGWKQAKVSAPFDTDINGNPIVNSANDAFKSAAPRNFSVRYLTIKRYEPYYDQATADTYTDTVNNGNVTFEGVTYSAGQMYLLGYAPVSDYQQGASYVQVAYSFEIRTPRTSGLTTLQKRHPFQLRVLDQGLRANYVDPADSVTKLGHLYLAAGEQASRDVLLNGHGVPVDTSVKVTAGRITPATVSVPGTVLIDTTSTATFLIYMQYAETDFTSLGVEG